MVNIREKKRFENEFKQILENENNNKNREFKISGILAIDKKRSTLDISKLIACSENYYEDLIKIYFENEFVFNILKDTKISFQGKGILYLIVEKDSIIELEFISKRFNSSFVKILIKSQVCVNCIIYSDSNLGFNNVEFILEKNAKLNLTEIILGIKLFHCFVKLNEGANYDLKSSYFLKESNSYILNKVIHLQESSSSNLEINGATISNSKVICDGFVNISQNAKNSIAHQKLNGIILDSNSSILGEPVLNVENSQVKCSHGFSISQISPEILFYMNSRGILNEDVIKLVVNGFFNYSLENFDENIISKYLKKIEKKL